LSTAQQRQGAWPAAGIRREIARELDVGLGTIHKIAHHSKPEIKKKKAARRSEDVAAFIVVQLLYSATALWNAHERKEK
jgi:hypothetical protein